MSYDNAFNAEVPAEVTEMSPYALAKVASHFWNYEVKPQSLYTAVRQGRLPSFRNEDDKIMISREDALNFVNGQKTTKKANWLSALK